MKKIFVTGVSSGIGKATATHFLDRGYLVIGTCRNPTDWVDLQNKFPDRFQGLQIDLADLGAIEKIPQFLKEKNYFDLDALINNAGTALAGPFELQNFAEIQNILHLNVFSVMKLTQVLIPSLKKNKGRIVNVSSISGVNGTPFLAAYCASKYAIEGFSESIRRELKIFGITVVIVGPGSVKTPIWQKGFVKIKDLYSKTAYAKAFQKFMNFALSEEKNGLNPQAVVDDIADAVESASPQIRYAPIPRKLMNWYLPKLIPLKLFDRLNAKALGLEEQKP